MKKYILLISFILVANLFAEDTYLLINQNPLYQDEVNKISNLVYEKGRISIYTLNKSYETLTSLQKGLFRKITLDEISQYEPTLSKSSLPITWLANTLQTITAEDYKTYITDVVMFGNRGVNTLGIATSLGNENTRNYFKDEFLKFGYEASLHCYQKYAYAEECNAVGIKHGLLRPNDYIVVEGHFDTVRSISAGADDNASGAAGVMHLAKAFENIQTETSIIFLATNGEESGLVGSTQYVKYLKTQNTLQNIFLVLNLDMIGYNKNGILDIETNKEHQALADFIAEQALLYTKLKPNITMPAWGSDHVPFLKEKIPSVLIIESWADHTPCYHKECDKLDTINFDYATDLIRLSFAVAVQKAGAIE